MGIWTRVTSITPSRRTCRHGLLGAFESKTTRLLSLVVIRPFMVGVGGSSIDILRLACSRNLS